MAPEARILREHGVAFAAAAVATTTLLLVPFRVRVDFTHIAWLYLCVVGVVAWASGTRSALITAVLSFIAGNYFFTVPYGTFAVTEPLDLIQLFVFLAAAAALGALTGRVRERELTARSSEREATTLARLASEMAQGRDLESVIDSAVASLLALPDVETVVVWLPRPGRGLVAMGPGSRLASPADRSLATQSFEHVKALNLPSSPQIRDRLGAGWPAVELTRRSPDLGAFVPLVTPADIEGVLQVVGGVAGIDQRTSSLAVSISHLLAIFIASIRAADTAMRIKSAEEAARVKSVIVSAVSHELKTPLAAAMAAVTDLADEGVAREPEQVRRALERVAEDLCRLQTAITDLLDLSRLQSEEWMPHPDSYEAGEILGDVLTALSPTQRDRLVFRVKESPVPLVWADFVQVSRAVRAILDNALAYSPPETPIFLGAERRDDRTVLWVEDRGTGVADEDKPFIFDRAYRGQAGVRRPGSTGLGLTIARDLVETNSGRLRVEDAAPTGTRILIELPATGSKEP